MLIERKDTLLGWSGVAGRSLVSVTEVFKRRQVRGFVIRECARWLAGNLRSWAEEVGSMVSNACAGVEGRRWRDHQGVVVAILCSNLGGCFVRCEIQPTSLKGRRVLVCLPAGGEGCGWLAVADALDTHIGVSGREL